MMVYKGYQFKLKATPSQEEQFWQYCGAVRWVYNHMLAERQDPTGPGKKRRRRMHKSTSFPD